MKRTVLICIALLSLIVIAGCSTGKIPCDVAYQIYNNDGELIDTCNTMFCSTLSQCAYKDCRTYSRIEGSNKLVKKVNLCEPPEVIRND